MHDIYDPPPAPEQDWDPPKPEPLIFTTGDLVLPGRAVCRAVRGVGRWPGAPSRRWRWPRPAAGSLVILESWFTALGFLHRCPPLRLKARWMIFLAALVPWLVGLGVAVTLMLSSVLDL